MTGKIVVSKRNDGDVQSNLKAGNGQAIGTSQMYDSEAGRDNGIDSVKNHAAHAQTVDDTD